MAGVVADPAFFLDQMGDPRRRPQAALVAQRLRPSLEAAFDSPQIFLAQSRFPSRSSGPLQPPQSAFLQLLRPATDGLSMSTDAAGHLRLVYALPQQFGRLTAALFQPYEVPANSCWISHAETVAQKISSFPSPLMSPTAMEHGQCPVAGDEETGVKVPSPLPRRTLT